LVFELVVDFLDDDSAYREAAEALVVLVPDLNGTVSFGFFFFISNAEVVVLGFGFFTDLD
jgi:hypothetical protein